MKHGTPSFLAALALFCGVLFLTAVRPSSLTSRSVDQTALMNLFDRNLLLKTSTDSDTIESAPTPTAPVAVPNAIGTPTPPAPSSTAITGPVPAKPTPAKIPDGKTALGVP